MKPSVYNNQQIVLTTKHEKQNPLRQKVITYLADKLAHRLLSLCPSCQTPGFGMLATEPGLPCLSCYLQTELAKNEIWGCVKCDYKISRPRRDGISFAAAKDCAYCNP